MSDPRGRRRPEAAAPLIGLGAAAQVRLAVRMLLRTSRRRLPASWRSMSSIGSRSELWFWSHSLCL
jgi:hypothetical protein